MQDFRLKYADNFVDNNSSYIIFFIEYGQLTNYHTLNDRLIRDHSTLAKNNPAELSKPCGDSYISEIPVAIAFVIIQLPFHSHEEQQSFEAQIREVHGLIKVVKTYQTSNNNSIHIMLGELGFNSAIQEFPIQNGSVNHEDSQHGFYGTVICNPKNCDVDQSIATYTRWMLDSSEKFSKQVPNLETYIFDPKNFLPYHYRPYR